MCWYNASLFTWSKQLNAWPVPCGIVKLWNRKHFWVLHLPLPIPTFPVREMVKSKVKRCLPGAPKSPNPQWSSVHFESYVRFSLSPSKCLLVLATFSSFFHSFRRQQLNEKSLHFSKNVFSLNFVSYFFYFFFFLCQISFQIILNISVHLVSPKTIILSF